MFALLLAAALADTPVDALPEDLRPRFEAAEVAWTAGEFDAAEQAYVDVTTAAPTFDRAWRRQCGVVLALGRVDDAITLCRKAVSIVPSVENQTGLAIALLQTEEGGREAKELLEGAVKGSPDFLPAWQGLCTWAMAAEDAEPLARCVVALEKAAPGTAGTLFYRALLLAEQGNFNEAVNSLRFAGQEGLTEDLTARGNEWIRDRARRAEANEGKPAAGKKARAGGWALSDFIPLAVLGALVLAVVVLAFGKDDDAKPPSAPAEPPPSPTPPPSV